ncbi:MAG TPA: pyridoxamine 5'-phosphate oxidase family protein [Halothiobacillus sp.]|nr:pyridoxamine 5'-phosphate oxidase family protein [Halothiobacillus sp.]
MTDKAAAEKTFFHEDDVTDRLKELIERQQSLLMATLDATGFPYLSYAPYVWVDGFFLCPDESAGAVYRSRGFISACGSDADH